MSPQAGGFLHYLKERYVMTDAVATWRDGRLSAYGCSDECAIYFCGIPFGSRFEETPLAEIAGRTYRGERETPFSEGRLRIADEVGNMNEGEIVCLGVSPTSDAVILEFTVEVDGILTHKTRKLTGSMRCRIVTKVDEAFLAEAE